MSDILKSGVDVKKGVIIGIFAAKGGVGKTTFSTNLATLLAKRLPNRVLLIDANVSVPNIGIHLGILNPPVPIQSVIEGEAEPEEAVIHLNFGLDVIAGRFSVEGVSRVIDWKGILTPLLSKYSVVVMDSSPGLGSETLSVMRTSDLAVVVSTPTAPALAGTLQTIRRLERLNVPIACVVVNMIMGKPYEIPVSEIRRKLKGFDVFEIEADHKVPESIAQCRPVVLRYPMSSVSRSFMEIAAKIMKLIQAKV